MKLAGLHENANDFFEAARRCSFRALKGVPSGARITYEQVPLQIPEMVNMSFACELYLKAIAEKRAIDCGKIHNLEKLFKKLGKEDKQAIYEIWLTNAGENCEDDGFSRKLFADNLEACAIVFTRFRYAHEWTGWGGASLHNSFTPEQFEKFSPLSATRPFGSTHTHDGFMLQFAMSLKTYADKLLGKTHNS